MHLSKKNNAFASRVQVHNKDHLTMLKRRYREPRRCPTQQIKLTNQKEEELLATSLMWMSLFVSFAV